MSSLFRFTSRLFLINASYALEIRCKNINIPACLPLTTALIFASFQVLNNPLNYTSERIYALQLENLHVRVRSVVMLLPFSFKAAPDSNTRIISV
jgi:hypothetical protein